MVYMAIILSALFAAAGLSFLEFLTEGRITYFPVVIALLLIIPIRQMRILTRDIDRISKKMLRIQDCLQVNAKNTDSICLDKTMNRDNGNM